MDKEPTQQQLEKKYRIYRNVEDVRAIYDRFYQIRENARRSVFVANAILEARVKASGDLHGDPNPDIGTFDQWEAAIYFKFRHHDIDTLHRAVARFSKINEQAARRCAAATVVIGERSLDAHRKPPTQIMRPRPLVVFPEIHRPGETQ